MDCESARGPDADRHAKILIHLAMEGSTLNAYSQLGGDQAERCDGNLPFDRSLTLSIAGRWRNKVKKSHFSAVAQTVVFGLGGSKMIYLSTGVDCRHPPSLLLRSEGLALIRTAPAAMIYR